MAGSKINLKALAAPFPAEEISWRLSHTTERNGQLIGMALAYYDARVLYDRLDEVCGPANWQIRYPHANGKTCAEIGIRIDGEWVWKANGAGDTQVEAEKGAFSDAAKRAGVPWGIGRYLYEMKNVWVECEKKGKSATIKADQQKKLDNEYKAFLKTGKFTLPEPVFTPEPEAQNAKDAKKLTPEQEKIRDQIMGIKEEISLCKQVSEVENTLYHYGEKIITLSPAQQDHIKDYAEKHKQELRQLEGA